MIKIVAVSAILLGSALTADAAPLLRQPAGKWIVDYGETGCNAARAFGPEKTPATFALRPSPNGTVVRMLIVRPRRGPEPEHFDVKTSISPAKSKTTGLRFASKDRKSEIVWINFNRSALDALPAAGEIALSARSVMDERFALPGIAAVLKALDICNEDLRAHWNVGDAAKAKLAKPAVALKPLIGIFSSNDYPAQAFSEGATGATGFTMMIDERGVMRDCIVDETSGIASLDAQTCAILHARAKFTPALDAEGKPARSVNTSRIRWEIAS